MFSSVRPSVRDEVRKASHPEGRPPRKFELGPRRPWPLPPSPCCHISSALVPSRLPRASRAPDMVRGGSPGWVSHHGLTSSRTRSRRVTWLLPPSRWAMLRALGSAAGAGGGGTATRGSRPWIRWGPPHPSHRPPVCPASPVPVTATTRPVIKGRSVCRGNTRHFSRDVAIRNAEPYCLRGVTVEASKPLRPSGSASFMSPVALGTCLTFPRFGVICDRGLTTERR